MYRGFNLNIRFNNNDVLYKIGLDLYEENKFIAREKLNAFFSDDGSLNGSQMQENWFPQIKADIFISHSHKDIKTAITLAGWLSKIFGINSFIDSCIWGYADDLLKIIDNEFCLNPGRETYDYRKRNYSTSHVHMMLSTALSMMIDKTECLFFLNTPNSISPSEVVDKTESPWIYSEIAISRLIEKKPLDTYRRMMKKALLDESKLKIKYDVYLGHLTDIGGNDLSVWKEKCNNEPYPLNKLYELNP